MRPIELPGASAPPVEGGVADDAVAAERAAGVDGDAAGHAVDDERATRIDGAAARRRDRAVDGQLAAIDGRGAGIGVDAGQDQISGAFFLEIADAWNRRTAAPRRWIVIGNHAAQRRREIIAADHQRVPRPDIIDAGTLDRTCVDPPVAVRTEAAGEIDKAGADGDELRGAAVGIGVEEGLAAGVGHDLGGVERVGTGVGIVPEIGDAAIVGDDGRAAGRGVRVELKDAEIIVGDRGLAGGRGIGSGDLPE